MNARRTTTTSTHARIARKLRVAPVTRAIRSVLAVSAAALALGGTGSALAADCLAPSANPIFCNSQVHDTALQPVIDLTTVGHGDQVAAVHGASAGWSDDFGLVNNSGISTLGDDNSGDPSFAASNAQSFGAVQNLTAIGGGMSGPGGASGSDNDVGLSFTVSGSGSSPIGVSAQYTATATDGYADALFVGIYNARSVSSLDIYRGLSASGTTWAAGLELEVADGYAYGVRNGGASTITAIASGDNGYAWGIYGVAPNGISEYNDGLIDVSATGNYGTATGLFGYASDGTASTDNTGTIYAGASGNSGQAFGTYANGYDGASATNSGDIHTTAFGGGYYGGQGIAYFGGPYGSPGATGMSVYSYAGDATAYNSGYIYAGSSGSAVGINGGSYYGDVTLGNTASGDIVAYSSGDSAVGIAGYSYNGDVTVYNDGTIDASSTGKYSAAIGMYANGYNGASASNSGDITATAFGSYGYGYGTAIGISVNSYAGTASADNTGSIFAGATGTATGLYGYSGLGDVSLGNSATGSIGTYSEDGRSIGMLGRSGYGNVAIDNSGAVNARSNYGLAVGVYGRSYTGDITLDNAYGGTIFAETYNGYAAVGMAGISNAGDVSATNSGNITALSYSSYGDAFGVLGYAGSGNVSLDNMATGGIYAFSVYGDAFGLYGYSYAGDVSISNDGNLRAVSIFGLADGIFASGVNVDVTNTGDIVAASVDGYWAAGIEAQGDDLTTVYNNGSIYAYTSNIGAPGYTGAESFGIYATGGAGGAQVTTGLESNIEAQGPYATGIYAQAGGPVTVTNAGDVYAGNVSGGYLSTGIHAGSNYPGSDVSVDNSGYVYAASYYGATGIEVLALGMGGSGSVTNSGYIYAGQSSKYGSGAAGIVVSADGDATVDNNYGGTVLAVSGGTAYGILALSFAGDASVTNAGDVSAYSIKSFYNYSAYGIIAVAQNGSASVDNSGNVTAISDYYGSGLGFIAQGIVASGLDGATVTNSGSVTASGWRAYGISASSGNGDVSVTNSDTGTVDVYYSGPYGGKAYGVYASSVNGDVSVDNAGGIYTYSPYGRSIGVFGLSSYGDVTVDNSGAISAQSYYNLALGIYANAQYGTATVDNSGLVAAATPYGNALGVLGVGYDVAIGNSDTGAIYAIAGQDATGIQAYGYNSATVSNDGLVVATSTYFGFYGPGDAIGIDAFSNGDVTIDNGVSGDVIAVAKYAAATGVSGVSIYGDTNITNAGQVHAGGYYDATGIYGFSLHGDVTIDNSGTVEADSTYGDATGIYGFSVYGDTSVTATSSSAIYAYGYGYAFGVYARSIYGDVSVANSGSITANAIYDNATGVYGGSVYGNVAMDNSGSISAYSPYASAVSFAGASYYGDVSLSNSGTLDAYTLYGNYAIGMLGNALYGDVTLGNAAGGSITTYAVDGDSYGIFGFSVFGDVNIDNAGAIAADSNYGPAAGIYGESIYGNVGIDNSGTTAAHAVFGNAFGIKGAALDGGATTINNSGTATAVSAYGDATGISGVAYYGDVSIDNSGHAVATTEGAATGIYGMTGYGNVSIDSSGHATATSMYGDAIGIHGLSTKYGDVTVDNSGYVGADSMYGTAYGILAVAENNGYNGYYALTPLIAYGSNVSVTNSGDITASSTYGGAFGIAAIAFYGDASIDNSGTIHASAYNTAGGAFAQAYGNASVTNSGDIQAVANDGALGAVAAAQTGDAFVGNTGSIGATADYFAIGALATAKYTGGTATVYNGGSINANATDPNGSAYGVAASSYGHAYVYNSGSITATGDKYAVGVMMYSATSSTLVNTGSIHPYSSVADYAIAVLGSDVVDSIYNYGDIYGAIVTGGDDDLLVNDSGGKWFVNNHSTDFGDDDDTIYNMAGGEIHMMDGAIYLGSSTASGNAFVNDGTIFVAGDNLIDMGSGAVAPPTLSQPAAGMTALSQPAQAAVPSLNVIAFMNTGLIDFVDGMPDDMLTIVGDFGGSGDINIDISVLSGSSDILYVDGSIVDGTTQTVNVAYKGVPKPADSPVAFAYVTGDSNADDFVGGQVIDYDPSNFINVKTVVTSSLDASNVNPDVFYIGVAINGLNDTGVLAGSIASGAHSLINSQIGTWRQRVGVLPDQPQGGLSPWVRFFTDKGEVNPSSSNDFGDASDFSFDQDNWGRELGMNFNVNGKLNYGVLLGKADGKQRLLGGMGTDRLKLNTAGLYATWVSNGFYVDWSYRAMDFDAELTSAAGQQRTSGNATANNIEAGYSWNLGGFDLIPQVQYTRTKIDNIGTVHGNDIDFVPEGGVSERGRVGLGLSKTINSGNIIWTPYGSVNAIREFDGKNGYTVADIYHGQTSTEGTSSMVELGVGMQAGGFSATGGVNWTDGGAQNGFFGGQLVLRYSW